MIKLEKHSGIYTLTAKQVLPISIDEAWSFFSKPSNLAKITPAYMGFNITSSNLLGTYSGQIITYKIGVFPGIKTDWVTEITHFNAPNYFVDEQRFGPYKMWHHEHIFESLPDRTVQMIDRVSYKLPFGIAGTLFHQLYIKNQLDKIFTYRYKSLQKLFPT